MARLREEQSLMQLREVLQTLDIELELDDEAIITDCVVVCKVQRLNGTTSCVHAATEGTDWITIVGLTKVAHMMSVENLREKEDDE